MIITQVGIPRALYYFQFYPLWEAYLSTLGLQVTFSPPTNQEILELGLEACVDGACLPLKAFVGHVRFLARQGLGLLWVPQVISLVRGEYACPNLLGLPDLVRQYVSPSVRLLTPVLDARRGKRQLDRGYLSWGLQFAALPRVLRAWQKACVVQRSWEEEQGRGHPAGSALTILLLGPGYLVDDAYLNGNLQRKLQELGVAVVRADLPDAVTVPACRYLTKRPYWTTTRRALGALEHFRRTVDGVISIAPFGCGAEAMQGVLVNQRLRGANLPYLELYVDEHSSPVGLHTRLEAFCDLLERKKSG